MTNPTTDLLRVVELVEKATPGPWRVSGTSHLCDAKKRHIIHPQGEDGEAIAAAVNFIREHGRTLLEAMRDAERVAALEREVAAKQARIDALMFEYCPDEMTPEQVAEWARHQRPVSEQEADATRQQENGDERG